MTDIAAAPSSSPSASTSTSVSTSTPSTPSTPSTSQSPSQSPSSFSQNGTSPIPKDTPTPQTPTDGTPSEGAPTETPSPRFKVKVNGEEMEIAQDELVKGYQRARAAQQRLEEAHKKEQQAVQLLEQLRRDPEALLRNPKLGINLEDLAEKIMYEKIQNEMLTPEQRAQRERDARLEKFEAQERARREALERQEFEHRKEQSRQEFQRQFIEVLEKSGIPKSQEAVARLAKYYQQALKAGIQPDPYDIAEMVKEDFAREQSSLYDSADDESLIRLIGEKNVERIRKKLLAQVSGAPGVPPTTQKPSFPSQSSAPAKEKHTIPPDEYWAQIKRSL